MTIVSIDTHRGAFRTRGRSTGGPGESVDQDPRIHEDKNMAPGQDDHARFARLVLPHLGDAYSLARWITGSRLPARVSRDRKPCGRERTPMGAYHRAQHRVYVAAQESPVSRSRS